MSIVKKERIRLLYRGIGVRTGYMGLQTVLFFLMVNYMGKYFKIDLTGID